MSKDTRDAIQAVIDALKTEAFKYRGSTEAGRAVGGGFDGLARLLEDRLRADKGHSR